MAKFFLWDRKGVELWHVLLIGILAIGIYVLFLQPTPETGPDIKGVVKEGLCTSRTGTEVVICCLKENSATGELESVPCDQTIVKPQALFTSGDVTYNIDAVCFAVKATNSGNVNLNFDVTGASTTASNGGDAAGVTEFDNSWQDLVNAVPLSNIVPGAFGEFSMRCTGTGANPIRLSTGGFTITNGIYTTTITVRGTSPGSGAYRDNQRVIIMNIQQEQIGFTIDIKSI